ncbi:MAG: methyltransferase domain-containing protein [Candidatus Nealsonbacteria bacterium]
MKTEIKKMKLHLGCGNNYMKGYINCDYTNKVKVDKIVNLEKKLPFEDNSIDEIYSRNTFEHINDFMGLMKELYRICKPDAKLTIIVPYFSHYGAFQDPTHKRFFALRTFDYFDSKNSFSYYSDVRFKVISKRLTSFVRHKKTSKILDKMINFNQNIYERLFSGIFPAEELTFILEVKK